MLSFSRFLPVTDKKTDSNEAKSTKDLKWRHEKIFFPIDNSDAIILKFYIQIIVLKRILTYLLNHTSILYILKKDNAKKIIAFQEVFLDFTLFKIILVFLNLCYWFFRRYKSYKITE